MLILFIPLRFIQISSEESEKNLSAFQHGNQIYFRVCQRLTVGEKLCVWYSSEYMRRLQSVSRDSIDRNLDTGETPLAGAWEKSKDFELGQRLKKNKIKILGTFNIKRVLLGDKTENSQDFPKM